MAAPTRLPDHKRGASFHFNLYLRSDGSPVNITADKIRSQIRSKIGVLLNECQVRVLGNGRYDIYVTDTNKWPPAEMVAFDIDVVIDGETVSTGVYEMMIERDITRPIGEA